MGSRPSNWAFSAPGPLRLYSTTELLLMPPPTWLIEGILPAAGVVGLYGAPGTGKSFLSIDWAMSIATGRPWQGRQVQPGYVLYISAEGGAGIGKRALAWCLHHQIDPKDARVAWLIESVPISPSSEQMDQLINRVLDEVRIRPALAVIDTLARCFMGNENQQEDMGAFIAGVDSLRHELGCSTLINHHTRLDGTRERGNTSFRGAADTMLAMEKHSDRIELSCKKQKDHEEFTPIDLELVKVDGSDSCVIGPYTAAVKAEERERVATAVWEILFTNGPLKWDEWVGQTGLSSGEFFKYFPLLKDAGRVSKVDGKWVAREV